jgi:hypothetical protein
MTTVIVYSYTVNDQGKMIQLPSKRTTASISEIGAFVLLHTAQEVDSSELRSDGRYLPKWQENTPPTIVADGDREAATIEQTMSSRRS